VVFLNGKCRNAKVNFVLYSLFVLAIHTQGKKAAQKALQRALWCFKTGKPTPGKGKVLAEIIKT
jgi:hypothetical protein